MEVKETRRLGGTSASAATNRLTAGTCRAAGSLTTWSGNTQTYGYTRGRLTSVPGFATALTYHPSGMVATVVRTNGITDYQRADATGQARPVRRAPRPTEG